MPRAPLRPATPRSLRLALGLSLARAAILSGVGSTTVRIYEIDPTAVNAASRRRLSAFYASLRREAEQAVKADAKVVPKAS